MKKDNVKVTANPADKIEQWELDRLTPYARNSRTHSDAQVAQIAASIAEWGFTTPILVDPSGSIIAGHGRALAARRLGMGHVPVVVADGWSDAKRRAYVIADNKLAQNAGWDEEMLALELGELGDPRSPSYRLHHRINWRAAAPLILRETVRKQPRAA